MTDIGLSIPTATRRGPERASSWPTIQRWLVDWSLALPIIIVAIFMLLVPCIVMVRQSFADGTGGGFTFDNWVSVFGSKTMRSAMINSLMLGFTVATIALVVGTPLAWIVSRMTRKNRAIHLGILNVATNFSGIGLGFAYVAALGTYGMVTLSLQALGLSVSPPAPNTFWGLVLAYQYSNLPLFVLLTLPAMSLLRDEWWEAAQACSASRLQFWLNIGWPVLRSFLLASWLLIFTWSVGMYGVPVALLGTSPTAFRLVTVEMSHSMLGSLFGSQRMPVLAVSLMVLAAASLTLYRIIVARGTLWLK